MMWIIDVLLTGERETRDMRVSYMKLHKGKYPNKMKKYSFLQRTIVTWIGLKEEVTTYVI